MSVHEESCEVGNYGILRLGGVGGIGIVGARVERHYRKSSNGEHLPEEWTDVEICSSVMAAISE